MRIDGTPADRRRHGAARKSGASRTSLFGGGFAMRGKRWGAALLAAAGLLAGTSAARAADTFRLVVDRNSDPGAETLTLGGSDASDADTVLVARGWGGGHRGGFHHGG